MKKLLLLFLVCLFAVNALSIVSSDPSIPTSACEGRPAIEEWIKQRKQIPFQMEKAVLVTVSKVFNDDLKRMVHSAETYDQPYVILGLCDEWNGENLLQQFLESLKSNNKLDLNKLLILHTSTNNIFSNSPQNLVASYSENFPEGSVVFRGERFGFPKSIEGQLKSSQRYKYPNSQAFLGPANELSKLFAEYPFDSISAETLYEIHSQHYYTTAFLNLKEKFKMQVDSGRKLFASLYGKDDNDSFQIRSKNGINTLIWRSLDTVTNELTDSHPVLVGDLPSSFLELASSGSNAKEGTYIRNLQKEEFGQAVLSPLNEREIRLGIDAKFNLGLLQNFFPSTSSLNSPHSSSASYSTMQVKESNKLMIGLFLSDDDLFVRLILEGIENLDFPKEKTAIFINYKRTSEHVNADIEQWIEKIEKTKGTTGNYFSVQKSNERDVSKAKREALLATVEHNCDYYFTTDAVLENKNTVKHLIEQKKKFISPLLTLELPSTFSNMWGEINWEKQGYKKHSLYPSIVGKEYVGVLRVPLVWGTFMIHSSLIPQIADNYLINPKSKINWKKVLNKMEDFRANDDWWIDLIFSMKTSFELDDGIWLSNKEYFGLLADKDEVTPEDNEKCDYDKPKVHKELFAYPNNKLLFKRYYYNPQFYDFVIYKKPLNNTEVCPDAFAYEFMRTSFGEHLIEESENYGKWSGGGHKQQYDKRIGGTEHYPTQDIHMNQMGLHEIWLDIIKTDVAETAEAIYGGIATKGYNIAFIVRYKPGAQSFLNPHNDASLYTIAVALNKPGRDFQGGGVRFVRRNCTYIPPDSGYTIMHPGRLTHKHEGLETTAGTRYIFVTFVQ